MKRIKGILMIGIMSAICSIGISGCKKDSSEELLAAAAAKLDGIEEYSSQINASLGLTSLDVMHEVSGSISHLHGKATINFGEAYTTDYEIYMQESTAYVGIDNYWTQYTAEIEDFHSDLMSFKGIAEKGENWKAGDATEVINGSDVEVITGNISSDLLNQMVRCLDPQKELNLLPESEVFSGDIKGTIYIYKENKLPAGIEVDFSEALKTYLENLGVSGAEYHLKVIFDYDTAEEIKIPEKVKGIENEDGEWSIDTEDGVSVEIIGEDTWKQEEINEPEKPLENTGVSWNNYMFSVDGYEFQLPCSLQKIMELGYSIDTFTDQNSTLDSYDFKTVGLVSAVGDSFSVVLQNMDTEQKSLLDCEVRGVKVDSNLQPAQVFFPGSVTVGYIFDNPYGDPDQTTGGLLTTYLYGDVIQGIEFTVNEGGIINRISMVNLVL